MACLWLDGEGNHVKQNIAKKHESARIINYILRKASSESTTINHTEWAQDVHRQQNRSQSEKQDKNETKAHEGIAFFRTPQLRENSLAIQKSWQLLTALHSHLGRGIGFRTSKDSSGDDGSLVDHGLR